MRFTHLFILLYILVSSSCKRENWQVSRIEGKNITINDSLKGNTDIEKFIKPFKNNIQKDLDSILTFSKGNYSKADGKFNTAIGNFMADAVYEESNPIFKKRTGKNIDMVLLNYGGIRSTIPKGNITKRHAFQLMPFENSILVIAMKGSQVIHLTEYLANSKKAHPISKLKLTLNENFEVKTAKINGKNIFKDSTYFVATNDYLYNGGDNMSFF